MLNKISVNRLWRYFNLFLSQVLTLQSSHFFSSYRTLSSVDASALFPNEFMEVQSSGYLTENSVASNKSVSSRVSNLHSECGSGSMLTMNRQFWGEKSSQVKNFEYFFELFSSPQCCYEHIEQCCGSKWIIIQIPKDPNVLPEPKPNPSPYNLFGFGSGA